MSGEHGTKVLARRVQTPFGSEEGLNSEHRSPNTARRSGLTVLIAILFAAHIGSIHVHRNARQECLVQRLEVGGPAHRQPDEGGPVVAGGGGAQRAAAGEGGLVL